jgi:hypothetical protein
VPDDPRRAVAGLLLQPLGGADLLERQPVADPGERRPHQATRQIGVGVEAVAQRLVATDVVCQHGTVSAQPLREDRHVRRGEIVGEADVGAVRRERREPGQVDQLTDRRRRPSRPAAQHTEAHTRPEGGRRRRGVVRDQEPNGVPSVGHGVRDPHQRLHSAGQVEAGQRDRHANPASAALLPKAHDGSVTFRRLNGRSIRSPPTPSVLLSLRRISPADATPVRSFASSGGQLGRADLREVAEQVAC